MPGRTFIIRLVVAVFAATGACPLAAESGGGSGHDSVRLQLKWRHQFQSAGFYAAIEQGYYREAGLDVELRVPEPDEDPVDVVLEGRAEYGVGTADLVIARSRGRDVVALAAIYQHSPLVLLARRDAGIETLHDLVGKQVMMEHQAAALLAYLRDERVPTERIDFVEHSFSPADLVEGRIDVMSAYSTDEPFLLEQAGVEYLSFTPRAGGIDFYGDTLFTTEREIAQHPQRVRAFVNATVRGWKHALDNPGEIVDLILSEYSRRHGREHLLFEAERSRRLIAADIVEFGYMNPGRWRYIAEVYNSLGLMREEFEVEEFLWSPGDEGRRSMILLAAGVLLAMTMVLLVSWHFYRLSRTLRREMAERAQAEQDLRASEERHRLLVSAAPFPVVITRLSDGLLRFINPSAAQVFGIDPSDLTETEYRAPEFYAQQSERRRLLALIETHGSVNRFETRLRSLDGEEFWVDMSATRLQYEDEECIFVAFSDITERKEMEQSLRRIADTDALTGVASRRRFLQQLENEIALLMRHGRPACVMSIDLDHFKQINDHHGHPAGDRILAEFARKVERVLRAPDTLGRLGGEEFAVLLRETTADEALAAAERVRAGIEHMESSELGPEDCLTVSVGVTEIRPDDTVEKVIHRVDELLYLAKADGRNCVRNG